MISIILSGIGLAVSAGLNAYLPILALALVDRATTLIDFPAPYNVLSSNWGLIVLLLILPLELIPDKIPRIDHLSDLVHTAIRPGAGALLAMAVASQSDDVQIIVAMLIGLVVAGAVHWLKASSRPDITLTTRGIGNPIISLIEDALAILFAVAAIFLPISVLAVVPIGLWFVRRTYRRMQTGETRMMALFNPSATRTSHSNQQG